MSKMLDFKLFFGLKLKEEMPEKLRNSLGDYLEEAVKKHIEPGLDEIVEKYAKEQGLTREQKVVETTRETQKISDEDMPTSSSSVEKYFSDLAKKKNQSSKSSSKYSEKEQNDLKEITAEIEQISKNFKKSDSPEINSLRAYRVLELRIKAEAIKMKSALEDGKSINKLLDKIKEDLKDINLDENLTKKKSILENIDQDAERGPLILKKSVSDLEKLQVISEDEYKKLNLEEQKKYLIEIKNQLDQILDFTENELKIIQSKLLKSVTKNLDFGEHLSIVLS